MFEKQLMLFIIHQIISGSYSLVFEPQQLIYEQAYDQDQFQSIWDISLKKNINFDEVETYSYGFWLKWSFVYPKIIEKQEEWHSISRLTSRENHSDYDHPQDRDLSIWMSKDFFHFTTYTIDYPEKFYNINYTQQQLDGVWNFVYFGYSYDEGLSRGYLLLNSEIFQEALIPAQHVKQKFIRFLIKREFQNQAFNGFYSNIFLSINEIHLKSQQDVLKLISSQRPLLPSLSQIFSQHILLDTQKEVVYEKAEFQQFHFENIDPAQYSISGWLKFEIPIEFKDSNLVLRLSHNEEGNIKTSDKIMYLIQNENNDYDFETYDCQQECQNLKWQIETGNEEKLWHFMYIAYDSNQKKIFQFWKFDQRAFVLSKENVHLYQLHGIYINLQKDEFTPGYNGQMRRWIFNYGNGAYQDIGFEDDHLLQQRIGLRNFFIENQTEVWKFQQNDLSINQQSNQDLQENEIDPSEFKIDSYEYGYGFWMRFIYNKPESKIKSLTNLTLGISRLGAAQLYKQKNNLGQNTLSILLQCNKILFQTYSIIDEKQKEFQLNHYLDGQWIYVYNGYKRIYDHSGIFLGCIYNEKGKSSCIQSENNIVHFKIENYLFFSIGSFGIKQNEYSHFNGYIQEAKLYFGSESIFPKFHEFQQENIPCNQNWITKVIQQYNIDRLDNNPSEFTLNDFVTEYSVQLWFKNLGNTDSDQQFIFILSQHELAALNEPGGLVLGAKLNQQNSIFILSQTFDENDYFSLIEKQIEVVKEQDIKQWTYLYLAYKQQNCYYFIQTKTQRLRKFFDCVHQSSNHYFLLKGSDGQNNKFLGDLDFLKVDFGPGSFQSEFNFLSESFKLGLKLFPTTFKWKQNQKIFALTSKKVGLEQIFQTNDKISMDGQKNYGYGFWSRFLTEFSTVYINDNNHIIISTLFVKNNQYQDLEIISFFFNSDYTQYKVKTYDLESKKYKFGTFDFQNSQEGIWNYHYLSYSSDLKQLVGFTHHSQEKKVMRIQLSNIHHKSINGIAQFILGRYFNYNGFNGQICNIIVSFDGDSFIDSIQQFQQIVQSNSLENKSFLLKKYNLINLTQNSEYLEQVVTLEENNFPIEYSLFGWFRPNLIEQINKALISNIIDDNNKFDYSVIKLSSLKEQIEEYKNKFNVKITQNGYQFITYSILKDSPPSSWLQNILLNSNFGAWCYFWIGYSQQLKQVNVFFKILDQTEIKNFYNIQHYLANYYQIIFSSLQEDAFKGVYQQIGMEIGEGSFKSQDQLPESELKLFAQALNYYNQDDDFEKINHLNLIDGKNDLIGSTEYSVYLWARWLHEISDSTFLDQNNLFRFSRSLKYEDCQEKGDRVLMVQITNYAYDFITYNTEQDECSINKNVNYDNMLEGQWNFIYFGYKNKADYFGAKGYVYFSKTQLIKQIEFKVEHIPLASSAVLTIGQNEFSYGKFYGQMHQIIATVGYGFILDNQKLLELTTLPEKDLNQFAKHNLVEQESTIDQLDNKLLKIPLQLESEYSIFGWFKIQQMTEYGNFSVLLRVSSNEQLEGQLGDDTLVILLNDKTIQFKSYTFIPIIENNQETHEVIKNIDFIEKQNQQWAFFYFGYDFNHSKLIVFLKFNEDLHEYQETIQDIYHYLPLELYIYIGQDNIYSKYYGLFDDFNFLAGESSFIEENIYKRLGSLNRKYIENILK